MFEKVVYKGPGLFLSPIRGASTRVEEGEELLVYRGGTILRNRPSNKRTARFFVDKDNNVLLKIDGQE